MMVRRARVGDLLRLERRPVRVDPFGTYEEIGVRSFGKGIFHKEPVSGSDLGNKRVFEVHPGDLVLSNVFAWEGAVGLAGETDRGRIGSHRFMTYVAASDDVDLSYVRYLFLSEPGIALLNQASPGSAGRNKTLAIDRFESLKIPLPEIDEQRRIAIGLERMVSETERISKLAKRWTHVHMALVPSIAQRHDLDERAKHEAGWERVRLGDVMKPASDVHQVNRGKTYPNAGILSFGRGLFEKAPIEGSMTSAPTLNRIRSGQFIYSRLFAFEGAYAEVTPRFDAYFVSHEFPTFDVDGSRAMAGFIAAYLRSPAMWAELARSSKGLGLRRQRIHVEKLLEFAVWMPPLEDQRHAVTTMSNLAVCAVKRAHTSEMLVALQRSMLNRAFAGLL
jgi:hypothetical protein